MNDATAEPVPAITEAEATGEIARLYADIRASLGVPVVNLIWRHFATLPGGLAWAWDLVRPLYHDGSIAAQATALRRRLDVPIAPPIDSRSLRSAGLSDADLDAISMILGSYERTNSMNIIALGTLLAGIDGVVGETCEPAPLEDEPSPVEGTMPSPLTLAEMPMSVQGVVQKLHRLGPADDIIPTMYRHLSHWPAYLGLIDELLTPLDRAGALSPAVDHTRHAARTRAAGLVSGLATPSRRPEPATLGHIRDRLSQFVDGPLAKMVTLVAIIRTAMPAARP